MLLEVQLDSIKIVDFFTIGQIFDLCTFLCTPSTYVLLLTLLLFLLLLCILNSIEFWEDKIIQMALRDILVRRNFFEVIDNGFCNSNFEWILIFFQVQ